MPLIDLQRISLSYPLPDGSQRRVFEDVSIRIRQGEHVYLIGPTGTGKSSLLRLLYLDLWPEAGTAQIGEFRSDLIKQSEIPFLRRSLGIVFQDFQLLPDRSVYENVAFTLYVTGKKSSTIKAKVLQALSRVGLAHKAKRFPHELSGGEQQRVVIARAIVSEPWVMVADEPTGNLDPGVSDEIMRLLLDLHRQGMTLVMATHDYRLIRKYPARTLAIMNRQLVEVEPDTL